MALSYMELKVQVRQTQAFINSDKTMVSFSRVADTAVTDNMGGRSTPAPTIINPQPARIVPARSRATNMIYTLPTGETVSSKDDLLVGLPSLDVELKDMFEYEGNWFQVSFINQEHQVQTICQLDLLGPTPQGTV